MKMSTSCKATGYCDKLIFWICLIEIGHSTLRARLPGVQCYLWKKIVNDEQEYRGKENKCERFVNNKKRWQFCLLQTYYIDTSDNSALK